MIPVLLAVIVVLVYLWQDAERGRREAIAICDEALGEWQRGLQERREIIDARKQARDCSVRVVSLDEFFETYGRPE